MGLGFLVWLLILSVLIIRTGDQDDGSKADVAIVLGAAVNGDQPSPVFEQRIRHGIKLYQQGRAGSILFTGGTASPTIQPEALVARRFALSQGVPASVIATETISRTTHGNLLQARAIMRRQGWETALLVSDPLHLKRSLAICAGLDMDCRGSATRTSRYRSLRTWTEFLVRELFYFHVYLIRGS